MPAKKKITKEMILKTAKALIKNGGEEALGVKQLAKALNCSTQPVYLSFSGMEELRVAVAKEIEKDYAQFCERELKEGNYPPYKAYGMAYIKFAREEKRLFRFLFMRNREGEPSYVDNEEITQNAVQSMMQAYQIPQEKAFLLHIETWVFVHGVAVMLATGYLNLSEEEVSSLVTDAFMGLKTRHLEEK